jgi:hypothetical protein
VKFLLIHRRYSNFEIDVPEDADQATITALVTEALSDNRDGFTEFDDDDEVYALNDDNGLGTRYV